MKIKFLFIALLLGTLSFAQSKGTISGVIKDKDLNNEALPFATVTVKGTANSKQTDIEGKYSIEVAPGTYILVFSFLGYESQEETVTVKAGEKKTINKTLSSGSVTLEDVVIESVQSRQKETALLMEQKNAVEIKQNIGAQELSRKGVSDAAGAVTKVTGISKQEGSGNIFVRGLGDRYNSTSMNGLPIPSNDPSKKNIALTLFATDIVEYISIDKVYSPRLYGDFAGGNVDIISKDFKGSSLFELEIGSSINTNAVKQDNFLLQRGPNQFGYTDYFIPSNPTASFNFSNSLAPQKEVPFGGNFNLKGGKSFNIGEDGRLSLFATAGISNGYSYREGINQSVSAQGAPLKSFEQKLYSYNTNTTGMFNAGYKINPSHKINYNFLFVNSSSQSKDDYSGFIRDIAEENNGLIQRGTYIQNQLIVNQLLGSHKIGDRIDLNWGGSYNKIESQMPDRTQNTLYFSNQQNGYLLAVNATTDNHRYYQSLAEDEIAANIAADYKFSKNGEGDHRGKITLGYNGRFKNRDFEATQFNFKIANSQSGTIVDPKNLNAFFNQPNYDSAFFTIETFSGNLEPQTYSGEQNIHAFFGTLEYKFSPKLTAVAGLRSEQIFQKVTWKTQLDDVGNSNTLENNQMLPSLVMKYEINDKNNIRFGASKTYTLPQFKERALFIYEDVTEVVVGNPFLYASDDYNVDLKWEFFPKQEEIISFTAFGKYIQNPINEITLASATNDISFINTGDTGYVVGGEFEIRKTIFESGAENESRFSAGLNASYMKTSQELDSEKVRKETTYNINLTNDRDSFTGASDLLANADITFVKKWAARDASIMATVAYTYASDRLYALGTETKGNLVDKGVGSLDLIFRSKINQNLGINFTARNILDPTVKRVQENSTEDVTVLSYKKGANVSLGLTYAF
ncbi:MAG TPA: TonB-dependent receptor [Flavobacterium sp.]|nr:TonB-dependent receptor [Flavobacterium sp.]